MASTARIDHRGYLQIYCFINSRAAPNHLGAALDFALD
jgi:hypothetical protein